MRDLVDKVKGLMSKERLLSSIIKPSRKTKLIELKPINYSKSAEEELKGKINTFFEELIYSPINKVLNNYNAFLTDVANSKSSLLKAIQDGKITFTGLGFKSNLKGGKFPIGITTELERLGARYNPRTKTFEASIFILPSSIQTAINEAIIDSISLSNSINNVLQQAVSSKVFEETFERLEFNKTYKAILKDTISQIDEIVSSVKNSNNIDIPVNFNEEEQNQIAREYTDNLKLTIKDFTGKQIKELREMVIKNTNAGYRAEKLAEEIQSKFNVSKSKAQFLATQETKLLMVRYSALKFTEGGVIEEFKWGHSFSRVPDEYHKTLYDNIYRFDNLPIIDERTQQRGLPAERFNCECRIIPVIKELL